MSPAGPIWEAFQQQARLYLRYNVPPRSHLGAVFGCTEALACLANNGPERLRKFLDVSVDSSSIKLSSCFLSVLIEMLNEGSNLSAHLDFFFFLFGAASLLWLFILGILEKLIESCIASWKAQIT